MKKMILPFSLLVAFIVLSYFPYAEGQIRNGGSGVTKFGGSGGITSGTTVITGGNDTSVCFDDGGVINCGDTGFLFSKTPNTITVLGNIELGHATQNTLSASSGILSVEGKALLDVSSSQTITAGNKDFEGGTFSVSSTGSGTPTYIVAPALTALTGADNICIGTSSCTALTTANQNVVIGSNAGDGATTGLVNSVLIGYNAGTGSNIGINNTAIGATALDATTSTASTGNTAVGFSALGAVDTGLDNTGVGRGACGSIVSTSNNTCIGALASIATGGANSVAIGANSGVHTAAIAIGSAATTTATSQLVVGAGSIPITDIYFSEGVTDATPLAFTINGTGGSGTDIIGGNAIVAGGKGTGTGIGGAVITQTSNVLGTGTTLQSLRTRNYIFAGTKALTAGAATDVVRIAIAQETSIGGIFKYCVRAADATDQLLRCGSAPFSGVNKAGTETCNFLASILDVCADTVTPGTCAVSTLTAAITCTSSTADTVDIEINAAAAITETSLNVEWSLELNRGNGAVTPQ